jgi:transposase
MPAERLPMRKIHEILRLKWETGLSNRQIAKSCCVSRSTIAEYLRRAQGAGLSWPLPEGMDDEELEARLFAETDHRPNQVRPTPNWTAIHKEMGKKGVTLYLVWQEYKHENPDGVQYSYFCEQYRKWRQQIDPVMRQPHKAGEKMFVDYCGQTMPVINPGTGEVREAQIFVAVLGASNYTFAEATWTQSLPDWIGSHVRTLNDWNGCPEIVVPDNLKSGVKHPCRYEPELNPTYQEWSHYYGVAILPTRVRKPRDKAKVESGVLVVERWILAPLRNRQFFSLAELNQAIREPLDQLNRRPFQKLPGCRRTLFEEVDQPTLKPLPVSPYVYAEWKKARVNVDYHIEVDHHYYSVPYRLMKQQVDVRFTAHTLECFHKGRRICSHPRSAKAGGYSTQKEHMPKSHREFSDWTPERLLDWAESVGPNTRELIRRVMESRPYPVQGFRSCLGILRLSKKFGGDRLENACRRALRISAFSYKSILSILTNGLDHCPLPEPETPAASLDHANIRGANYYH